jgi:hypothetical protein
MKRVLALACLTGVVVWRADAPLPAEEKIPPPVPQSQVNEAIAKGATWLQARLKQGLPQDPFQNDRNHAGSNYNEIVLYALLTAGIPPSDADLIQLVQTIRQKPPVHTYTTAIRAQALEKFDHEKLFVDVQHCAQFLVDNQSQQGYWGYSKEIPLPPPSNVTFTPGANLVATGPGGGVVTRRPAGSGRNTTAIKKLVLKRNGWGSPNDNSNTQYAMLGLAAAMSIGIYPPDDCFPLVDKWLTDCQNEDGGWGYQGRNMPMHGGAASYGSMTAGAVSTLSIGLRFCQQKDPLKDIRIMKGLRWLGQNLTFAGNPGHNRWHFYWIYSVERAGSFAGTQWFGERPWYSEGATWLVQTQGGDGSWGAGKDNDKILDTCWAILFLKQASRRYVYSGK